ncbi:MAG: hypothetical protein Q4D91_07375 [Lautropia sp.]|nr:hypothetical protein [Lautropia sp.]
MSAESPSSDQAVPAQAGRAPRPVPPLVDETRRAIDETPASQAFFRRLTRWFLPRPQQADTGSLVEKLVLLFSKLAVAISMIGLLVGGWLSMERYQANLAKRARTSPSTGQYENMAPAQRQQKPASTKAPVPPSDPGPASPVDTPGD